MRYRLKYDLHTHTTYSHGKGSIEDNVKAAAARGLEALAITDHGPGSMLFGMDPERVPEMRREIERLQPLYPQVKILLGVEANITVPSGHLDVTDELRQELDLVLAGYHCAALGENPWKAAVVHLRNMAGISSRRLAILNTESVVRAVYESEFKILTHPGDKGQFHMEEIARACADRGVLMEINNGHDALNEETIRICAGTDAAFIINSDAHLPQNVGAFERALGRALAAGLDPARIVNIEA
ncbi:MAG: PHP domain-containing protein, partial [Bacillota bacterium]|nr:PHP domain-containing protein [Bacillota bacterium]